MDEEEETTPSAPPPSYEDVIAAGSSLMVSPSPLPPVSNEPSYPPPSRTRQGPPGPVRSTSTSQGTRPVTRPPGRHYSRTTSMQQMTRPPPPSPAEHQTFIDKVALFNMPSLMLTGLTLPSLDSELDSEAHLPNRSSLQRRAAKRKKLKRTCGWLWCCGFTLLFLLIALPVAMLLTGIFGINSCRYNDEIIIICLLLIGSSILLTLICRLVNSGLSCCKLSNSCGSEKSTACSVCIAMMEGVFIFFLLMMAIIVLMCTWFMFQNGVPVFDAASSSSNMYCDEGVYYAAVAMVAVTYLSGFFLAVYMGVAGFCYYMHWRELTVNPSRRRKRRHPHQQRRQDF